MTDHVYRISVSVDQVEVRSGGRLTEAQLRRIGAAVGRGDRAWLGRGADLVERLSEPIVEIDPAYCVDADHRRNSIDGRTYACAATRDAPIHLTAERCAQVRSPERCQDPAEHHPYVSPGWEAPADDLAPVEAAS